MKAESEEKKEDQVKYCVVVGTMCACTLFSNIIFLTSTTIIIIMYLHLLTIYIFFSFNTTHTHNLYKVFLLLCVKCNCTRIKKLNKTKLYENCYMKSAYCQRVQPLFCL